MNIEANNSGQVEQAFKERGIRPFFSGCDIGSPFIRFFDACNRELAYWCPIIGSLHFFTTPREWAPEYLAGLRHVSMRNS